MRNGARKSPCNETRPCPYTKQEENKKRGWVWDSLSLLWMDKERKRIKEEEEKRVK
jgi:hypothetical protein